MKSLRLKPEARSQANMAGESKEEAVRPIHILTELSESKASHLCIVLRVRKDLQEEGKGTKGEKVISIPHS